MAAPSNYEQLILELINRARLDPQAEADRLGISLNKNLPAGTISPDSKQPLAHNSSLNDAATSHSNWMLNSNTFSHTGSGGSDPGDRMQAAGYQFTGSWTWGENIAWNGTTGTLDVLNAAQSAHDGLFDSAGHRENILNGNFKEVGLGASTGNFQGYNAFMLTENFAKSGTGSFITGVAYNDNNSDDFYSVGEGRAGVTISLAHNGSGIGSVGGWNSGGYALKTTQTGNIDVTFSGGGLASAVTVTIALASENAKVDLVGTNGIESSVTTTLGQNAADLKLLGLNDLAGTGNSTGNTIIGNAGDNELSAGNGNDTVQAGAGHDFIKMGSGNDSIDGGAGSDQISYFNSTAGIDIDLAAGTASGGYANGDTLTRLEKVTGSNNHGDALRGTGGSNTLRGKGGDDTFWDRGGDDILDGGAGQDVFNMGLGNDRIDGGTGIDHISYSASTAGITLDLAAGTVSGGHANGDTLLRLESATGSNSHSDSLKGTGGSNTLLGQGGHDTFWDRGGNDVLDGGAGHDVFYMGIGNDHVDGGTGSDHISYRSSSAGVTIDLAAGTASGGHANGDTLLRLENVTGSDNYADTLKGTGGKNTLNGKGGADRLEGRGGDDILSGGAGADTFVFASKLHGTDDITDFMTGTDEIELKSSGFDNVLNTGNLTSQYFVQGTSATQSHGQLLYNQSTGDLLWDADGTGGQAAEIFAELTNGTSLAHTDFFIV